MPEYRPLPDDDLDAFRAMVRYAFSITEGPWTPDDDREGDDETENDDADPADEPELGERYGYYDDDTLVSICKHYYWDTWVRDRTHRMAGLSAVATPPEYRRQGYVRGMLHDALAGYRDQDIYLSALWPFKHDFYRRLGWGTAFHGFSHRCEPSDLAQFRGDHDGTWVRLEPDDWERLDAVHDAHGAAYELTIERDEQWWRQRVFQGWNNDPFVYGLQRDGDLAAFVAFIATDDDDDTDGTLLRTTDSGWVDHAAREAIYGFFARHEAQVDEVQFWTMDDDLLWQVEDPRAVETERHAAAMFRLVDVPDAVEALTYPSHLDTEFVLAVRDPLVSWNDGRFEVSLTDGRATVEPTTSETFDASTRIDRLSQLYVGSRDVEFLTRTGALEADDETATVLDAMYPKSDALLREGF